jgi:hypothetical protein
MVDFQVRPGYKFYGIITLILGKIRVYLYACEVN